jgi:hypothetical protein
MSSAQRLRAEATNHRLRAHAEDVETSREELADRLVDTSRAPSMSPTLTNVASSAAMRATAAMRGDGGVLAGLLVQRWSKPLAAAVVARLPAVMESSETTAERDASADHVGGAAPSLFTSDGLHLRKASP